MLSQQEKNVAGKLFDGIEERAACRCHNMSYERLVNLYESDEFIRYLEVLFKKSVRQSHMELARLSFCAVKKLGKLMEDEKGEVARRASVDILNKFQDVSKNNNDNFLGTQQSSCEMSDDQAREMFEKLVGSNG